MQLTIEIDPQLKSKLDEEARLREIEPEEYACRLILKGLADGPNKRSRLLAMLDDWDREDMETGSADKQKAIADWEEFKASINAHHGGDRVIYP